MAASSSPKKKYEPPAALLADAQNEQTNADRLKQISEAALQWVNDDQKGHTSDTGDWAERYDAVLNAVAAHPNAPVELLTQLIKEGYSDGFSQNPVAPLVLLEAPDFWTRFDAYQLSALLRRENAPLSLVQALANGSLQPITENPNDDILQNEAQMHVLFAGELAPGDFHSALRQVVEQDAQKAFPDEQQLNADLVELGFVPEWGQGSAPLPLPPPLVLEPEVGGPATISEAQQLVAVFAPDASQDALAPLAFQKSRAVRLAVALHTGTGPDLLRTLAQDKNYLPLAAVIAQHPNTPPDVLKRLANASYNGAEYRRRFIVFHPNAPDDLLQGLAGDKNATVRRAARKALRERSGSVLPPSVLRASRKAALDDPGLMRRDNALGYNDSHIARLWTFVDAVYNPHDRGRMYYRAFGPWRQRLAVALTAAALSPEAQHTQAAPLSGGQLVPSWDEIRAILSRDGNRLVRAAAPLRFSDPHDVWE